MSRISGSPSKRRRATQREMEIRDAAFIDLVHEHGPCSVRHIFYQSVVAGVPGITKDQSGYDKVQPRLVKLRREGLIPYHLIVDYTRTRQQEATWNGMDDVLSHVAQTYRRNLWAESDVRLEVWCESDSIAGTISKITRNWAVPLFVARGQTSDSFAWGSVSEWAEHHPDTERAILYIGDHDPHGLEIEGTLREKVGLFNASGTPYTFRRLAVTWDQADAGQFPGSRPKKRTYSVAGVKHSYDWPESVEAEAMPPHQLRDLLNQTIESYVDPDQYRVLLAAEKSEREVFSRLAESIAA